MLVLASLFFGMYSAVQFPVLDTTRWQTVYSSTRQRISVDLKTMKGSFGQYDVWLRTDFSEPVKIKGRPAAFVITRESVGCGGTTYTWEWVWYTRRKRD
jgi:hypothetical protein